MPVDPDRPRKRQRVTQACQRCRSKKFRCDGEAPSCGPCLAAQATCLYNSSSGRQRGLQPGYVKVLESLWGIVFQNIPGSEHVASQLLAGLHVHAGNVSDDPGSDEASPLRTWRDSGIPAAIRTVLGGGLLPNSGDASIESTAWNLPLPSTVGNAEIDVEEAPAPGSPDTAPSLSLPLAFGTSCLPDLPLDWQTLVQVYLCTEYCCLPIFEKSSLYRWAYNYQDQLSTNLCHLDSSSRGNYTSLWAVLVLGELHLNGAESTRIDQMKQAAKALLVTAESLAPDRTYAPAYLLWALVYTGHRKFTLAQMMLAQATVLANVRSDSISKASDNERETLVQMGCSLIETILAFASGTQRCSISVGMDSLSLSDVGEWDPFINFLDHRQENTALSASIQLPPSRTGSTFQAWARLMAILGKASQPRSSPRALVAELESWEALLPANLRGVITTQPTAPRLLVPPQLNLQLWYAATSSTIAGLQHGNPSAANLKDLQGQPLFRVVEVLDTTERHFGLRMLPATASVFVSQAFHHGVSNTSPAIDRFSYHWGWPNIQPGIDINTSLSAHQVVATSPRMGAEMGSDTTFEHRRPEQIHLQNAADLVFPTESLPGTLANDDDTNTHLQSQQRHTIHPPTTLSDPTVAEGVNSFMEPSPSHDLLDYLTIFEGNDCNDRGYMEALGFLGDLDYSV